MSRLPSPRQRADGRWEAQIELTSTTARRKRQSVYGHTEAECRTNLIAALADKERDEAPMDRRITVAAFMPAWLKAIEIDLRPHTRQFYESQVRLHIVPFLGAKKVAALTRNDVQALINAKTAAGLAPKMVRHIRSTLRAALSYAVEEKIIRDNPAASRIRLPVMDEGKKPNAMTPDQVRRLLDATEGDRLHALWILALRMGLRQAEILGLQWSDLNGNRLSVNGQLQHEDGRLQRVPFTKTPWSRREVVLPDQVVASLNAHKLARHNKPVTSIEDFMFSTHTGGPLGARNVIRDWHLALKKAHLPRFRFHDTRHTAATNMLRAGIDIKTVAQILGHRDASMLLRTYAHVQTDHLEDAARKMEAMG